MATNFKKLHGWISYRPTEEMKFNFDQLVSIIFTIGLCNVAVMLARIMKCMITTPVVDGQSF